MEFAFQRNAGKIAVIDGNRQVTYAEFNQRAKKLANALLSLSLKKGDKLGLLIYNCQEYFEIRAAAYFTGIILVPLVWDLELEDIAYILNDCRVRALIYHPSALKEALGIIKQSTRVENFIPITENKEKGSYEDLLNKASPDAPKVKIEINDLASINFSSGTTARPKGVLLAQKNWMNSFYNYLRNSPKARQGERVILHVLSFATAGGAAFLPVSFLGAKNIILDRFDSEKATALILKHKVNTIFASPSILISLLDYCQNNNLKLPLNAIVVGTEIMPQEKFKQAIEFFGPIIQESYGMVEVLPPLSLLCSKNYLSDGQILKQRLTSCGKMLKGVRVKIVDENGRKLPMGETGRVALGSSTLAQGYLNNLKLSKFAFRKGWFYSEDFGYLDKEGYLYILGRKSDSINRNGETIFARQIEEVLHRHQSVLGVSVLFGDNNIYAFVSLKKTATNISPEDLMKFCKDNLSLDKVPLRVKILAEIPINASGKTDRKLLKKMEGI